MMLPALNPARLIIGIDTGVKTGLAIWNRSEKKLVLIGTYAIDAAMAEVLRRKNESIFVRVEDARLATFGRRSQGFRARGAGSVMRDAKIWEDFLRRHSISHEMIRPRKQFTKWPADHFKKVTGWPDRTNSHGRDAAMLVYGY